MTSRIFCALDTADLTQAETWVRQLAGLPLHFKLGLEFFTAQGIVGVEKIRALAGEDAEIFLDLKFHDIPHTVAGAVRSALNARPQFLTIHASGGGAMIRAAVETAQTVDHRPKILAVTVLTHLDENDLIAVGQSGHTAEQVLRLAQLAQKSGADGVICSPREIEILRKNLGPDFLLVVPGIRPTNSADSDQKRTLTPEQALKHGADYLVIGRPITGAPDPAKAAQDILATTQTPR